MNLFDTKIKDTYIYVLNQSGANPITLGNNGAVDWNAGGVVALTGNQTISGTKTFSNEIVANKVGSNNAAAATSSSAFGYGNIVYESNSSAFGYANTTASAYNSSAFGYVNTASSYSSSAFGATNTASSYYSSAFGYTNTASAGGSSAFGSSNNASEGGSSAFGHTNTASSYYSSAFGYGNTASAVSSSAFGHTNTASAVSSSAFGSSNTASAVSSSAFGYGNTASAVSSSAFGAKVKTTISNTLEAGFWVSSNTRSAALRMHSDGTFSLPARNSSPINGNPTVSVTDLTRVGTLATATTSAAHNLLAGQQVTISGASPSNYNGIKTITSVTSTTFAFAQTESPATPATGTISAITADGSEKDGSIPIGTFTIRRNALEFFLTYNDNGSIKSVSLGSVE